MAIEVKTNRHNSAGRALLTGAFGSVGEWVLRELLALGYEVVCFDKDSESTSRKARKLGKSFDFTTIWGDLTKPGSVMEAVRAAQPDVIAHVGAVIPPLSIKNPLLAEKVNVEGTRNLIEAAALLPVFRRFVLVSSYSVHGACNPHRNPPLWTGSSPLAPHDDYGRHKVEAEALVRGSKLPFCIVRLCAVLPVSPGGEDPDTLKFSFLLPYERRTHAIDVRDAGLAVAKACYVRDIEGRTFDVGGGAGWQMSGGQMSDRLNEGLGLLPIPRTAYRLPDPNVDSSWFSENWVDTSESQSILGYQRYSVDDYLKALRKNLGLVRFILPIFKSVAQKRMLRQSPFYGKAQLIDERRFAVSAKDLFS